MKYRTLGRTGLQVSAVGFGAWAIGGDMWGPQDDRQALEAIARAWDLGCTFYDTAAVYGDGHSEELVGRFMRETGHRPVVATKVPPKNYRWPAGKGTPLAEAFPAGWIVSQTETSLKRLGLDCVDLQQLHVWCDEWTGADEWYEALTLLREQGKIRFFGVSLNTHDPDSGLGLVASGRVDTIQVVHNIFEQTPQDRLFPAAVEHEVGIIARVPFDESALTGKLTKESRFEQNDFRNRYFAGDRLSETVDRVEALRWLVPQHADSMASAALRFCLSQEAVSTVIPGIRNPWQAQQNCSAADLGGLPTEALLRLSEHRWDRTPKG
jgi:aryl-alcohol dehydrogenase-like predicted oxidoreductase